MIERTIKDADKIKQKLITYRLGDKLLNKVYKVS